MNSEPENQSIEDEKQERIKALLVRIGEKSASPLEKNLELLSKALLKDLEEQGDFILEILLQSVVHLTSKTGVYSTLVGLLNKKNPEFGKGVVQRVSRDFEILIASNDFAKLRIIIRFVAMLSVSRVVPTKDLFSLLNSLLDSATDFFFYCVFGVLPYCGAFLLNASPEDLTELLRRLSLYSEERAGKRPHCFGNALESPRFLHMSDGKGSEDALSVFYKATMYAADREWTSEAVLDPSKNFKPQFSDNIAHSLEIDVEKLAEINAKEWDFCPLLSLSNAENDRLDPLSRCILFEYYSDILIYFEDDFKECSKQLELLSERNQSHALLIESLFSLLLQLPRTQSNPTVYGRVIAELFRSNKKVLPKILAKCLSSLFDRIDDVDVEGRDRLANWFAFHLNNFGFKWAWESWSFVTELPENAPKRIFCKNVLAQCKELSFQGFIEKGQEISKLIPVDPLPIYEHYELLKERMNRKKEDGKETAEDTAERGGEDGKETAERGGEDGKETAEKGGEDVKAEKTEAMADDGKIVKDEKEAERNAATAIVDLHMRKSEKEELSALLDRTAAEIGEEKTLEIFFNCLLTLGSERLSSLFRVFDIYKAMIMEMKLDERGRRSLVKSTMSFWGRSPLHRRLVLQKLLTYGFVEPPEMLGELLKKERLERFHEEAFSTEIDGVMKLYEMRFNAVKALVEKERKDALVDKMEELKEMRKWMLKFIVEKLSEELNGTEKTKEFRQNRNFWEVLGRLVMFLRKNRNLAIEIKEDLKESIQKGGPGQFTKEVYESLVAVE